MCYNIFKPAIRINETFKIFNGHFDLIENGVFKMVEKGASTQKCVYVYISVFTHMYMLMLSKMFTYIRA